VSRERYASSPRGDDCSAGFDVGSGGADEKWPEGYRPEQSSSPWRSDALSFHKPLCYTPVSLSGGPPHRPDPLARGPVSPRAPLRSLSDVLQDARAHPGDRGGPV